VPPTFIPINSGFWMLFTAIVKAGTKIELKRWKHGGMSFSGFITDAKQQQKLYTDINE
jgi:hypothetical protein